MIRFVVFMTAPVVIMLIILAYFFNQMWPMFYSVLLYIMYIIYYLSKTKQKTLFKLCKWKITLLLTVKLYINKNTM